MKSFKKTVVAGVVASIILGTSIIAYAAPECMNCRKGQILTSNSYGEWYRTGKTRACQDEPWGQDIQIARSVKVSKTCNYCSIGTNSSRTEYDWECHGHSRR